MIDDLPTALKFGAVLALSVIAAGLAWQGASKQNLARQINLALRGEDRTAAPRDVRTVILALIRKIGDYVQKLSIFSQNDILELERAARGAGYDPETAVPVVIGGKLLLIIICPAISYFIFRHLTSPWPLIGASCGAGLGLFGPNFAVRRSRDARTKALRLGLSDALDLLVVCAEAGLALESAIDRVAAEMLLSHPEIAAEFFALSQDLRLSPDRGVALARMGEKVGLESFQRLTMTLSQTLRYGTPLGQALRNLAIELRNDRLLRLEEKAARLPTLLMIPLAVFILPCLFIVVAGPAVLRILFYMH